MKIDKKQARYNIIQQQRNTYWRKQFFFRVIGVKKVIILLRTY